MKPQASARDSVLRSGFAMCCALLMARGNEMHRFTLISTHDLKLEFTARTPASILNVATQKDVHEADAYQNDRYIFSFCQGSGSCWIIESKAELIGRRVDHPSESRLHIVP